MRLWYSPALLLLLCSCTMPIQTSTQVRTVQTTDLGVVKHPAMDLLASNVSVQGKMFSWMSSAFKPAPGSPWSARRS